MLGPVRLLLSSKWLLIHAIAVGLVLLFVSLGWWQLHRAESGNTLSYAYALEWPSFALLVIGFWLKTMRDEVRRRGTAENVGDSARARRARDDDAAELAVYNRFMADRARARDPR